MIFPTGSRFISFVTALSWDLNAEIDTTSTIKNLSFVIVHQILALVLYFRTIQMVSRNIQTCWFWIHPLWYLWLLYINHTNKIKRHRIQSVIIYLYLLKVYIGDRSKHLWFFWIESHKMHHVIMNFVRSSLSSMVNEVMHSDELWRFWTRHFDIFPFWLFKSIRLI